MGSSCCSSLNSWCFASSLYQAACYRSWWFSVFSQPQTSLVLVTYVAFAVLNGVKSFFHIPDHCILGGCAIVLPQIYRFGISLPELLQLPPADGTLAFPLQDECEEQPQIRLRESIQQLVDTKGGRPQSVPHCERCGQQGSSAAKCSFLAESRYWISGQKPSQILWTDYYRKEMLFLCHCFIRGCICN